MRVLLVTFMLSSCGSGSWDYGASRVYDRADITMACDVILDHYDENVGDGPVNEAREMNVRIEWSSEPVSCGYWGDFKGGCQELSTIRLMERGPCIAETSLSHEIMHLVLGRDGRIRESVLHSYPYFCIGDETGCYVESANKKVTETVCTIAIKER